MNIHKHALTYSMAAVFTVIAYSLGIYLAGVMSTAWNYISYVFFVGILVFAIKNWRDKERAGVLSYGKSMGYSTWFALYYCIVMAIWTFVFFSYIAPDYMDSAMIKQEAMMEAQGMPADQVEMGMKYARMFTEPSIVAVMAFLGSMFFLTILNLIVSAFMKKDPETNFGDQSNPSAV